MNTFKVNFKSGAVYCANLAKAETAEAVARHYSKYEWFSVKPATAGDIREAETKGMPVCVIAEEPAPAEEPAASPKMGEISDKVRRREARYAAAVRAAKNAILSGEDTAAERVTISRGNDKMGAIPSVSLRPLTTCPECARATCGNYCYAAAMADNGAHKNVAASYARNTAIALTNPAGYWAAVRGAIAAARFFRFHVSGDAISREYVAEIFRAAEDFPRCDILIFTKRFAWFNDEISARGGVIPGNLHVMFSGGAGIEIPNPYRIPVALFVPHGEEIPAEAKICGGNCLECGCRGVGCWQLSAGMFSHLRNTETDTTQGPATRENFKGDKMKTERKYLYTVEYIDPITGAKSPIDNITAGESYTAHNYIADCERYSDPEYIEMISAGAIELINIGPANTEKWK